MRKLIRRLIPPEKWQLPVVLLMGIITGLGIYIFMVSNAASYLSDEPETCINCHVMNSQYASWQHSSHRETANCNDCHVPHNNFLNKYFFKAKDGMRHASIFTLRMEPQVIRIKEAGKKVVHKNCIRCHGNLLEVPHLQSVAGTDYLTHRTDRVCWDCHQETPHSNVNSLSSASGAMVPQKEIKIQKWLENFIDKENTK